MNGPSQDKSDRLFGLPTSLLYAIAPSVQAMNNGLLDAQYYPTVFDPWVCTDENYSAVKDALCSIVENENINILCVSSTYDDVYPILRLLSAVKQKFPETVIIVGGPHFDELTDLPEYRNEAIGIDKPVDFIIAGDGEILLLELLQSLSRGSVDILQVARRSSGRGWIYDAHGNVASVSTLLNLNGLPFLPVELSANQHRQDFDIFMQGNEVVPTAQMIAMRGCPEFCIYCSERKGLAYPNHRSIENIMGEISLRKAQGYGAVFFDDSTFGAYPHINDLLVELRQTGMQFGCLNRFDRIQTPDVLEKFSRAGFTYMYCSIEHFNPKTLNMMGKGQSIEHIKTSLKLFEGSPIKLGVPLMFGFEYETESSIKATLDFTAEWAAKGAIILVGQSLLTFHPGTPEGKSPLARRIISAGGGFNRPYLHTGYPWDQFEESGFYHHKHVNADHVAHIAEWSNDRLEKVLIRNRQSPAYKGKEKNNTASIE
ncbi:MAG: B12-binding domain-containing radical SAM protein [Candidatus Paceibacterota bacterium]